MGKIQLFDSSLRDGAQAEGIAFSVDDKIKIVKALDKLGIDFIEAGNPTSNPKDLEFFERIKNVTLSHTKIVAFGSTRRRNCKAEEDEYVKALLSAGTEAVAIFGKSWDLHVEAIIKTTLEENLNMISDTIKYFVDNNRAVIFDAEHFFDGYKANKDYALSALKAAKDAGAECLVLCDTNGGTLPQEIYEITKVVKQEVGGNIGIHCHDDGGMAVANSIMAVEAGALQVQGTFLGFGERCGNANLCTLLGNLQLKMNYDCIKEENIEQLTQTARYIAEVANIALTEKEPYIGRSAFAHKGGMHIDGVRKVAKSFEHVNPDLIGNQRKFLMSEVAGRSYILKKIQKVCPTIEKNSKETIEIMDRLKQLEHMGYQFEGAESTFELVIRKHLGKFKPFFELVNFKIIGEQPDTSMGFSSYAMVKVKVGDQTEVTAAEGDGPVHALDVALRKALEVFYPELSTVKLTDYKVRVLDTMEATASKVRVLIESADETDKWTTVGVSADIIEASLVALVDSIEYKLLKNLEKKAKQYL